MIGWLFAGMLLGAEHRKQEKRREERLEARRARPPRPVMAWSVFAAVAVMFLLTGGLGTVPFLIGAAVGVTLYERRRRDEHEAWLAEQSSATVDEAERVVRDWQAPR